MKKTIKNANVIRFVNILLFKSKNNSLCNQVKEILPKHKYIFKPSVSIKQNQPVKIYSNKVYMY